MGPMGTFRAARASSLGLEAAGKEADNFIGRRSEDFELRPRCQGRTTARRALMSAGGRRHKPVGSAGVRGRCLLMRLIYKRTTIANLRCPCCLSFEDMPVSKKRLERPHCCVAVLLLRHQAVVCGALAPRSRHARMLDRCLIVCRSADLIRSQGRQC